MNAILIIASVSVFLILAFVLLRTSSWKTVMTAPGSQADELQNKHAYLHGRGIRSRIREQDGHPVAGITTGTMHASEQYAAMNLQVHKDDIERAHEVLEDYTHELHTSNSPLL
ncbi:hypothetical protein [Paenibacillus albus]|uniref:Uncharacterized protein n=1 Tax=Paenibacillus albus TaxID=2495582 RepID=A0A3Q8X6V6_9BACL|nr:hypothetical protein [Paenibacillus albus]AZN41407.1 hypothetical protein EJC50_18305 [Paenibacillus albus]